MNSDTKNLPDSEGYIAHLKEAEESNLNDVAFSNCVQQFQDQSGRPVIVFIPKLALEKLKHLSEEVVVRRMLLLFIRQADAIVQQHYSLVYCHTSVSLLSQRALILEYYHILPRRYKKNLQALLVIHPHWTIRVFFEFTRIFLTCG